MQKNFLNFPIVHQVVGLTLLIFGPACATSFATVFVVGKSTSSCPNATYSAIGDAVNAAGPQDEIDICPGLYPEQLVISKPLTLRGLKVNGVNRVLLQPALGPVAGLSFQAVISVVDTEDVAIQNVAIDASNNTVSGCAVSLAGIHFHNASGIVDRTAVSGAQLANPASCPALLYGNGFGIQVDTDSTYPGPFHVVLTNNSIHDFSRNGILVVGSGVTATIDSNQISGVGPSIGTFQFGIFLSVGAAGSITRNIINEGLCGALSMQACVNLRSEGIVLRSVGNGTLIDGNVITNAQSGIFANGGNHVTISNNIIGNIDALDAIDIQGTASGFFTNSIVEGNTIFNVGPIAQQSCGIYEASGTGVSGNTIVSNNVNDGYCGVAYVTGENLRPGEFVNTLYSTFNVDMYPNGPPPATEPSAAGSGSAANRIRSGFQRRPIPQ